MIDPRCFGIKLNDNFKILNQEDLKNYGREIYNSKYSGQNPRIQPETYQLESENDLRREYERERSQRMIYDDLFEDDLETSRKTDFPKVSNVDREFDNYCDSIQNYNSMRRSLGSDLMYWKTLDKNFPNVSRMARDYLSIQACQAASERLFSSGGNFYDPKRNRTKTEALRMCLLLRIGAYFKFSFFMNV